MVLKNGNPLGCLSISYWLGQYFGQYLLQWESKRLESKWKELLLKFVVQCFMDQTESLLCDVFFKFPHEGWKYFETKVKLECVFPTRMEGRWARSGIICVKFEDFGFLYLLYYDFENLEF